jgi:hypothetical protein
MMMNLMITQRKSRRERYQLRAKVAARIATRKMEKVAQLARRQAGLRLHCLLDRRGRALRKE